MYPLPSQSPAQNFERIFFQKHHLKKAAQKFEELKEARNGF